MFNKLGKFLKKKGLPLLGSVMGGPASVVGVLASTIAGELGLESDNEDELIKHIESNPDTVYKLKKLEADNKVELKKLSLQGAQIAVAEQQAFLDDRADSRSREENFIKATGGRDWSMTVLSWTVTVGFLGAVAALIFADIPDSQLLLVTIGMLGGGFTQVLSYYFGSSKGSSDKNNIINAKAQESLPKVEQKSGGLG